MLIAQLHVIDPFGLLVRSMTIDYLKKAGIADYIGSI